jgi:hypothetical protein
MLGNILPALEVDRSRSSERAKLDCWRKLECATARSFRKRCLRGARHPDMPLAKKPRRERARKSAQLKWSPCALFFSVTITCVSNAVSLRLMSRCKQWGWQLMISDEHNSVTAFSAHSLKARRTTEFRMVPETGAFSFGNHQIYSLTIFTPHARGDGIRWRQRGAWLFAYFVAAVGRPVSLMGPLRQAAYVLIALA